MNSKAFVWVCGFTDCRREPGQKRKRDKIKFLTAVSVSLSDWRVLFCSSLLPLLAQAGLSLNTSCQIKTKKFSWLSSHFRWALSCVSTYYLVGELLVETVKGCESFTKYCIATACKSLLVTVSVELEFLGPEVTSVIFPIFLPILSVR